MRSRIRPHQPAAVSGFAARSGSSTASSSSSFSSSRSYSTPSSTPLCPSQTGETLTVCVDLRRIYRTLSSLSGTVIMTESSRPEGADGWCGRARILVLHSHPPAHSTIDKIITNNNTTKGQKEKVDDWAAMLTTCIPSESSSAPTGMESGNCQRIPGCEGHGLQMLTEF
ncbi:hypothetical protein SprV_0502023500 [Sparganum proliferum]